MKRTPLEVPPEIAKRFIKDTVPAVIRVVLRGDVTG
jgi:hypothetical protein